MQYILGKEYGYERKDVNRDGLVKNKNGMAKKKVQDQGERILRIEAYLSYAAMTKDEA